MKTLLNSPLWAISVILLFLHQFLQKILHFPIPIFDNWLDPFLSMPILLGLILVERRWFLNRTYPRHDLKSNRELRTYYFSFLEIVITVLFFSFVFEILFPKWTNEFTYDRLDFLAYALGGIVFYFNQSK